MKTILLNFLFIATLSIISMNTYAGNGCYAPFDSTQNKYESVSPAADSYFSTAYTPFGAQQGLQKALGNRPGNGGGIGQVYMPIEGGLGIMLFLVACYGLIVRYRLSKKRISDLHSKENEMDAYNTLAPSKNRS
jgi:hypothetical protein